MTFRIGKTFSFAASHQLNALPDGHKCKRLHGHNYTVEMILEAEALDDRGFVVDYGDLDIVKKLIDSRLDHRHLNEIVSDPTAERLAAWLWQSFSPVIPELVAIRVSETPSTFAEYRP